jgi:hypothetical protein
LIYPNQPYFSYFSLSIEEKFIDGELEASEKYILLLAKNITTT